MAVVYEFQLNDQTIMWDYATGFVHLTGIWKALGNSKADIVKLVDNHPELEGVIRRIRGGFLKIQGTWVPYDLCRQLATRTCYTIRHALISVFGPDFPEDCLKPDARGYGTLTLNDSGVDKKRKKRKTSGMDEGILATPIRPRASEREKKPRLTHAAIDQISLSSSGSEYSADSPPARVRDDHTSPPPIPAILDLPHLSQYPDTTELLDLLRATRSLQRLSTGSKEKWTDEGGQFNVAGINVTFHWDGSDSLSVIDDDELTLPPILNEVLPHGMTRGKLSRKFSSATQASSLGAITPPQQYQQTEIQIRRIPSLSPELTRVFE